MFMDFNLGDYKIPEASDVIKQLVKKFECNLDDYKQLKQEFINPFFKALGWECG